MNDPITYLLKKLGYVRVEPKPISVFTHMYRTTHDSWVQTLNDTGRLSDYEYHLWSESPCKFRDSSVQ